MALHPRQTLNDAVREQLLGKTVAQDRVVDSKRTPWRSKELPGISVYALDEETDLERSLLPDIRSGERRTLTRTVQVVIEAALALTDDIVPALNAYALEIEDAVDAAPTFGLDAVQDTVLGSTSIRIDPDAEQPVGIATLTYVVTYQKETGP